MSLKIRRVVTAHDQNGRAFVAIDEPCRNVISRRPNHASCVIWSTGEFPAENGTDADGAAREVGSTDPNGTVFRLVEYGPGVSPRNHRTESIDYAVVIAGEMEMDVEGTVVRLQKGDVDVQQNTMHNWINRGKEPCRIAFILMDSREP